MPRPRSPLRWVLSPGLPLPRGVRGCGRAGACPCAARLLHRVDSARPGSLGGGPVRRVAVARSEPAARTSRLTIPNYGFEDEVPGAAPPGTLLKTRNHGLRMARRVSLTLPLALACARAAHDCGRAVASTRPHTGDARLLGHGKVCLPRPTPLHRWALMGTPSSPRCSAWCQGGVWRARTSCRADFKLPRINTGPGSFFLLESCRVEIVSSKLSHKRLFS